MPADCTEAQQSVIIFLHKQGKGYKSIAKECDASVSTVCYTIKRFQERGDLKERDGHGRHSLTPTQYWRVLMRTCKASRFMSSVQLSAELKQSTGAKISSSTVRKILMKYGLRGKRPRKKLFVNERQLCRIGSNATACKCLSGLLKFQIPSPLRTSGIRLTK